MNQLNNFLAKLAQNPPLLGTCVTLSDPTVSELIGECGYDFTWIDMEHAPLNIETAALHIMTLRSSGAAPLVRVPWNLHWLIKPVLDLAPAGVIIPMVNSRDEAAQALAACRYPPRGVRGCGVRRGCAYGRIPFTDYLESAAAEPLTIIQIEHQAALSELDAILELPGLDCVCIGPADFSGSMGHVNAPDRPEIASEIDAACAKIKQSGKYLGTAVGNDPDTLRRWRDRQVDWICVASDWGAMAQNLREVRQRSREILGGN